MELIIRPFRVAYHATFDPWALPTAIKFVRCADDSGERKLSIGRFVASDQPYADRL